MLEPGAVSALLRLKELGFGTRRVARTLGISRNTVKSHIEAGGWRAYKQPARRKILDGRESWLRERFERHRGNADVVRQELIAEKGLLVSLRTIERGARWQRRREPRRGLRRRPASSFRSILASAWLRSPVPR
jgi:hypothetical protein